MSESVFSNAVYLEDVPFEDWRKNYIGPGYRSVCYMTDNERKGQVVLFGYDPAGNPKTFVCPHRSWIKYNVKYDTDEKDIFGRYVATKWFDNSQARRKYLEAADGLNVLEALRPESEFLQKVFGDAVFEQGFNTQPVRVQSLDIETEISDQFMKPSQADNRVNMITVHDSLTDKFYTWSLEHCEIDFKEEPLKDYPKDKFVVFEFHGDEDRMLQHFVDWIDDNRADVLFGHNIKGYDIPYLYTRLSKQLGKTQANRLSPVGKCFVKEVNHDNARADVAAEIEVYIDGVFQSDSLILYRDKFKIAGSTLDGGYSLDNIGEYEGCGHKIHYKGSLKDLYVKDWQKFYEYNVRDVDLCKRIDDKCKLTKLARTVAGIGLCNYDSIYTSLGYLIGSCVAFAKHKMGGAVFKSYLRERHNFAGFEGAYVFPCAAGLYRKGIGCIDFASLYPSIIRALNISIETYVGKVLVYFKGAGGGVVCDVEHESRFDPFCDADSVRGVDDDGRERKIVINAGDPEIDHLELKLPGQKDSRRRITVEQLRELIRTKCVWTPNNTLFIKHEVKDGVVAKWCEFFYAQRKANKKKEMKIFHDLHNEDFTKGLSPEERAKLETDMENYHAVQQAFKIAINSIYGACGTSFSPIADPNIAQTITRMGRMANKSSSQFVHDEFVRRYGADPNYVTNPTGDTDSCVYSTKVRVRYRKNIEI